MADMETNIAYGVIGNAPTAENNTYELVEVTPLAKKDCHKNPGPVKTIKKNKKKKKKDYCFNIFITVIAVTALLLVLIFLSLFLVHYLSHGALETQQSAVIESLQSLLNSSNEQLQLQTYKIKEAQEFIQSLQLQLNQTVMLQESLQTDFQIFAEEHQTNELLNLNHFQETEQELNNTINLFKHVILRSCHDLPQGSPSGYYQIKTSNRFIQVYCDTDLKKCSCNASEE